MPDKELQEALKFKLKELQHQQNQKIFHAPVPPISVFRKRNGLKKLLPRHQKDRFFILIDFVHAFHQVTREMLCEVFPQAADPSFEICFVKMGGRSVIPIGFHTSNYLFEMFCSRTIDAKLMEWQVNHCGTVTRYADNILATWAKNTPQAFVDLKAIFRKVKVRFAPRVPRKWGNEPIRFCGVVIPREGKIHISRSKEREILHEAMGKSIDSFKGARQFLDSWEY